MKTGTKEVKSSSTTLGECEYPIYEALSEVVDALGEVQTLDLLNAQIKTNCMNAFRTARTKGPTKTQLQKIAFTEIMEEVKAGQHEEVIGNEAAMEDLISRKCSEIEVRMRANLVSGAADEDDDS